MAIAGSDADRTRARAAALGVAAGDGGPPVELLDDPSIDVVHVCTPNRTHVEIATAVLEAGKHLVLEKPVALDSASRAGSGGPRPRGGRHAAVALTYRGYPMVRRARALVQAGEVGDSGSSTAATSRTGWPTRPTTTGASSRTLGGASRAVADIGSHWFDTAEFISGLRVEAVFADLATFLTAALPARSPERSAFGTPTGRPRRSPCAPRTRQRSSSDSRAAPAASAVISQVSPGRKNAFNLELAGSRATLDWDQEDAERLWVRTRDEARSLTRRPEDGPAPGPGIPSLPAGHPEGWAEALRDLLRPFYAAIAAGEAPAVGSRACDYPTLDDGARGVAFVEAVLSSASAGRWVSLPA